MVKFATLTWMAAQAPIAEGWGTDALRTRRESRRKMQEAISSRRDQWIQANRYFYDAVAKLLRYIVEPGRRVLDIRCQTGRLLQCLAPSEGVGVEISDAMIAEARKQHPEFTFVRSEPEDLDLGRTFDYILANYIFETEDIQTGLERIRRHCDPHTRVLVLNYNPLWEPVLKLASRWGLRTPIGEPNGVTAEDIEGFLHLAGFRHLRTHHFLLFPKHIPLVSSFLNGVLAKLPGIRRLGMMQVAVARIEPHAGNENSTSVSVIVPCRNERGNIQPAVERIPEMGSRTEIVFCDDQSSDGTADEVRRMQALYPEREIKLVAGPGVCKAQNVWTGFRHATGDVLMILDADLTVMPEELPFFFRALVAGRGEFINGSRLVYPMPKASMRFFNRLGNRVFGRVFSYLLSQRFKDTLCGTKALWRKDWSRIENNLGMWGIQDLWGDYELILGASKLHLEIAELPVHYQERIYGVSKMTRVLANGIRMAKICRGAWKRLHG